MLFCYFPLTEYCPLQKYAYLYLDLWNLFPKLGRQQPTFAPNPITTQLSPLAATFTDK